MPRTTLKPARQIDQVANLIALLHRCPEFRYLFKCLLDTDVAASDRRRDHLRDAVNFGVRHVEGASDVLNRGLRSERPESHDLADRILTVKLRNVIDDLGAAADAEIHVDIRHRNTLGVKETLEEEVVL